jgi:glycosyltransferase involved in cell wall biosynthesis
MKKIIIKNLDLIDDIQANLEKLKTNLKPADRLFIKVNNNIFKNNNWLERDDLKAFLNLSGFEVIATKQNLIIAKIKNYKFKNYSISIIIPAKNESQNINGIIKSIPNFGKSQEIIFIEGNSNDNTWNKIQNEIRKNQSKNRKLIALKQKGTGKADAIRHGFKNATGEILIVYDSDRTVDSKDLIKFYNTLASGQAEFANGNRLVYPMEVDAMRLLNKIANKLFGILFTRIFGQKFKDTLCGTKAFFKKDYLKFSKFKDDPFGDFELIFGAIQNNLKVIEIPVKYKERIFGTTNIKRFYHGFLLVKIIFKALWFFSIKKINTKTITVAKLPKTPHLKND